MFFRMYYLFFMPLILNSVIITEQYTCKPCECSSVNNVTDCSRQRINSVLKRIPFNLNPRSVSVILTGQPLENIPRRAFFNGRVNKVQVLRLNKCSIRFIHSEALINLEYLTDLDISSNIISELDINTFSSNKELRNLNLAHNKLEKLESGVFVGSKLLENLEVSYNKLQYIAKDIFGSNGKLLELDIRGNRLSTIDKTVIESVPNLTVLYLYNNPWICDCRLKKLWNFINKPSVTSEFYGMGPKCSEPFKLQGQYWKDLNSTNFMCWLNILAPSIILESQNATLACLITGSSLPDIKWKFLEYTIDPDSRSKKYYISRKEINAATYWYNLTVTNVTLMDQGEYRCWKNSSEGIEDKTVSLTVLPVKPPVISTNLSSSLTVDIKTKDFKISCRISGVPLPDVMWLFNGSATTLTIDVFTNNYTIWTNLTIPEVTDSHTGIYTCKAKNAAGTTEKHILIHVRSALKPVMSIVSDSRVTIATRNVTLSCSIRAVPKPDIKWIFRFLTIKTAADKYIIENSTDSNNSQYFYNVTILNINDNDAGQYICMANNTIHDKHSETFDLKVKHLQKPDIETKDFSFTPTGPTPTVMIQCKISSFPKPNLSWMKNAEIIKLPQKKYFLHNRVTEEDVYLQVLKIVNVTKWDTGEYWCIANNSEGESTKKYSLIVDQKPDKLSVSVCVVLLDDNVYKCVDNHKNVSTKFVQNPEISNTPSEPIFTPVGETAVVSCQISGFPPPNVHWLQNGEGVSVDSSIRKFLIDQSLAGEDIYWFNLTVLDPTVRDSGDYTCMAKNSKGQTKNIFILEVYTPHMVNMTWTYFLCLLFGIVVLTGVIFLMVLRCRNRNCRYRIRNWYDSKCTSCKKRRKPEPRPAIEEIPLSEKTDISAAKPEIGETDVEQ